MKTAIFDVGNVLIDFDLSALCRMISEDSSASESQALAEMQSERLIQLETGHLSAQDYIHYFRKTYGLTWNAETWAKKYSLTFKLNAQGNSLRKKMIARGNAVCLLSNISEFSEEGVRRVFPEVLENNTANFYSYELGLHKPSRAIYQKVADRLHIECSSCVMIDDRIENVEGAVAAGMTGFHFIPENYQTIMESLDFV